MSVLVTGGAGFIGSHLCEALLKKGLSVICLDNFDPFYDPQLKHANLELCHKNEKFSLINGDILDKNQLENVFKTNAVDAVFHLAALAGVRPSIQNPARYAHVNVVGTTNLLELAQRYNVKKCLLASTSSIYGNNTKVPFSESDLVNEPVSPYAASKRAAELMAYNMHHLYGFPVACIRFFTVYGPRQRPEMAIHKFTRMIDQGERIPVFNHGHCLRDYTYIDDIIQGVLGVYDTDFSFDIINLGESQTISTLDLITLIEEQLGKKARLDLLPAQDGDVEQTFADISKAKKDYGYDPKFSVRDGFSLFMAWYQRIKK